MKLHINACPPVELSLEEALQKLHVQEDFHEEFEEIHSSCMQVARPKYCFAEYEASIGEHGACIGPAEFESRILQVLLRGLSRAFPSVVTCGRELHDLIQSLDDPLQRYWAEGIAELLMERAGEALRREIRSITGGSISALSPGSLGDFPITEQGKLFALLGDPRRHIGVELTPQSLMLPVKSASAIYLEAETDYENCMLCLRSHCPKRRRAFDETAFRQTFGLTEEDVRLKPNR